MLFANLASYSGSRVIMALVGVQCGHSPFPCCREGEPLAIDADAVAGGLQRRNAKCLSALVGRVLLKNM
jgi:hypothetical protein